MTPPARTSDRPLIEVEVTFRKALDGGRCVAPSSLQGYRPHIVVGDPMQKEAILTFDRVTMAEEYLGVAFTAGPAHIELGHPVRAEASLLYWPGVDYSKAIPGATFTLREGGKIVGHGRIIRRSSAPEERAGQQRGEADEARDE